MPSRVGWWPALRGRCRERSRHIARGPWSRPSSRLTSVGQRLVWSHGVGHRCIQTVRETQVAGTPCRWSGMDLNQAMAVIGSRSLFSGESDQWTANLAQKGLVNSVALAIPELHGGAHIRPVDLLLHLAYATRLNYQSTVLDAYMQWGIARYIGAFDVQWHPNPTSKRIVLSDAARRVVANQRRVLSEDIGIGLASLLSRRIFASRHPGMDLHLVDIDMAIASGLIDAPSGSRTDFLVVAKDRQSGNVLLLGLVEAKGSESRANGKRQLVKGAAQIEETTVSVLRVPGVVSVAQSGRDEVRYSIVKVEPQGMGDIVDLGSSQRAADLVNASWAKIADIGDEPDLYMRLAPEKLKDRRPSFSRDRWSPKARQEVRGNEYEGTEAIIPLPGGRLHVFLGAETRLLRALAAQNVDEALASRERLRGEGDAETMSQSSDYGEWEGQTSRIESTSEEGVALVLRVD